MRRTSPLAIALLLAGLCSPAAAQDWAAYGQVLAAHVRPATIAGIRLAAVD